MSNFMDKDPVEEATRKVYGPMMGTEQITSDGKPLPRTKSKVAIMGFAPSTMMDVKHVWDDPELEIWGLNQMHLAFPGLIELKKASRWFQIHPKHSYDINVARDRSHHDWLKEVRDFPVYMIEKFDDVPMSINWPYKEIMAALETDYFTNSISWMLALAILERMHTPPETRKNQDIYIFGVDMAQSDEIDSEYAEQRPSCEFFVGLAKGLGIPVHIPDKSDLMKTMWLYPYEDNSPFRTKLEARRQEMRGRINMLQQQKQQMEAEIYSLSGAIENQHYIKRCWDGSINEQQQQNAHIDHWEAETRSVVKVEASKPKEVVDPSMAVMDQIEVPADPVVALTTNLGSLPSTPDIEEDIDEPKE